MPDRGETPRADDEVGTDYSVEEQAEWDERSEHERVADVTGVGPYDPDEQGDDER